LNNTSIGVLDIGQYWLVLRWIGYWAIFLFDCEIQ